MKFRNSSDRWMRSRMEDVIHANPPLDNLHYSVKNYLWQWRFSIGFRTPPMGEQLGWVDYDIQE